MKKKLKRGIAFVLTKEEIELLMEADAHFFKEFLGKKIEERYEFTYSYEALDMLGHRIAASALFTPSKERRRPLERLLEKVDRLLKLSDSLSSATHQNSRRF